MGYSAKASNIITKSVQLGEVGVSIKGIAFDSVWSGQIYDKLTTDLSQILQSIDNIKSSLNHYAGGLYKLQKYKDNCTLINSLQSKIYSLSKQNKDGKNSYNSSLSSLNYQLQKLIQENDSLKTEIIGIMSSFSSTGSGLGMSMSGNGTNYMLDINELLSSYSSGKLKKLADGASLYNLYDKYDENGNVIKNSGKEYIESLITNIQQKYSGRDAVVNSSLLMLSLASQKGVKLDYQHKGTTWKPYVPTEQVASGVDCNPYASWAIDKGVEGGFSWRPVQSFRNVGEKIEYENWSQAQPGDVFTNGGHVGIIIENNPEEGKFIVAHSSGYDVGIVLQEKSYNKLVKDGYQIQDMTAVYNGTDSSPAEYTKKVFTRLVNEHGGGWENYQRDV